MLNYVSESCTQSQASHAVCMSLCTCMSVSIYPFFPDMFYSCSLPLATLAYQSDFLLLSFQGNWNEFSQWSVSCLCIASRWQLFLFKDQSDMPTGTFSLESKPIVFWTHTSLTVQVFKVMINALYQNVMMMTKMQMNIMAHSPATLIRHKTHRPFLMLWAGVWAPIHGFSYMTNQN